MNVLYNSFIPDRGKHAGQEVHPEGGCPSRVLREGLQGCERRRDGRGGAHGAGSFYNHYPSKDEVFPEVCIEENDRVRQQVVDEVGWAAEPVQLIEQLFDRSFRHVSSNKILSEWENPAISGKLRAHCLSDERGTTPSTGSSWRRSHAGWPRRASPRRRRSGCCRRAGARCRSPSGCAWCRSSRDRPPGLIAGEFVACPPMRTRSPKRCGR